VAQPPSPQKSLHTDPRFIEQEVMPSCLQTACRMRLRRPSTADQFPACKAGGRIWCIPAHFELYMHIEQTLHCLAQVETASESSSPRSVASEEQGSSRRASIGQQRPQGREASARAAPPWLTDWRLKLALSSKVHQHRTCPQVPGTIPTLALPCRAVARTSTSFAYMDDTIQSSLTFAQQAGDSSAVTSQPAATNRSCSRSCTSS
jgi:hypothetical protein